MGGGDKPLLPLGDARLIDHVLARIRPQSLAIALSANGDAARFAAFGLPVLPDHAAVGPLAGILAGLRWVAREHLGTHLLSVPGDIPFLPPDLAARLHAALAAQGGAVVCAASAGRLHPTVSLWPIALSDILEAALQNGLRRVRDFAAAQGLAVAAFESADAHDPFFNVNTPADLAEAEARLAFSATPPFHTSPDMPPA